MAFDAYIEKALLDWMLQGATPTAPAGMWIGLATQSPTSVSAFEAPVTRHTVTFSAAASPAGSASNRAAVTILATAACTPVGWNIWQSSAGGSRWAWGTLTASVTCSSAQTVGFAAGGLKITLS